MEIKKHVNKVKIKNLNQLNMIYFKYNIQQDEVCMVFLLMYFKLK